MGGGELKDARLPDSHLFLEHGNGDGGIACGSDGAVLDGISEVFDGGRIVPQAGWGGLRHFVERAFELERGSGGSHGASGAMQTCAEKP